MWGVGVVMACVYVYGVFVFGVYVYGVFVFFFVACLSICVMSPFHQARTKSVCRVRGCHLSCMYLALCTCVTIVGLAVNCVVACRAGHTGSSSRPL